MCISNIFETISMILFLGKTVTQLWLKKKYSTEHAAGSMLRDDPDLLDIIYFSLSNFNTIE